MTNNQLTATVEHLIDAVGHWQQDYDPKEDSEQYDFFGQLSAALRELQECRKAEKNREPVAWGLFDFSNGTLYNFCSSESRAEQYQNQIHQSSDSLTLEIGPLYRHAQQPVVPDDYQHLKNVRELYHKQEDRLFALAQRISGESFDKYSHVPSHAIDVLERTIFGDEGDACSAAMLQAGNSPVIPEGYVMVPMRLTAENGAKGVLSGEFSETQFVNCPECFGDDECETCDGSGRIEIKVPVSWTTIKEIWIKGVEHFAAAPQENN